MFILFTIQFLNLNAIIFCVDLMMIYERNFLHTNHMQNFFLIFNEMFCYAVLTFYILCKNGYNRLYCKYRFFHPTYFPIFIIAIVAYHFFFSPLYTLARVFKKI